MRHFITLLSISAALTCHAQPLEPKQAYPFTVKQIHSGHSLTDPLFYPNWPGQYVNLMAAVTGQSAWQLIDRVIGKSTIPGSAMAARWTKPPGGTSPDARHGIGNWELLSITERVPLLYEGGSTQQWYITGIQEQRNALSLFVNNAWTQGNGGKGAPTLLWTTWVNIDGSNGDFRKMLDVQGLEWERMQDHANERRPSGAPPVYLIPGHKMMARLYDDVAKGLVPGITSINQFFSDNIHTNELGAYAIAMIHYACIYNKSPLGLPTKLIPNATATTLIPSAELAAYLQSMIWEVVTTYDRTGIVGTTSVDEVIVNNDITVFPTPAHDVVTLSLPAPASQRMSIRIHDVTGTHVTSSSIPQGASSATINISPLPPGLYAITAASDSTTQTTMVVKR
ncbi:MAG: T9SS type A sorting domain-containing protein [Bacteroidota bacterium]